MPLRYDIGGTNAKASPSVPATGPRRTTSALPASTRKASAEGRTVRAPGPRRLQPLWVWAGPKGSSVLTFAPIYTTLFYIRHMVHTSF